MSAQHTPGPVIDKAIAYCARLRAMGLEPTVSRLMRGVRELRRSEAFAAIAKAGGAS